MSLNTFGADEIETINTLKEIVENNGDPRQLMEGPRFEQAGGGFMDAVISVLSWIMDAVKRVLYFIFIELLANQLNPRETFKRKSNKSGFWKYIVWSAKCGFYLCIFAVAGPIFILIGISMVYSKLLKKISEDPNATPESVIRTKMAEADV